MKRIAVFIGLIIIIVLAIGLFLTAGWYVLDFTVPYLTKDGFNFADAMLGAGFIFVFAVLVYFSGATVWFSLQELWEYAGKITEGKSK